MKSFNLRVAQSFKSFWSCKDVWFWKKKKKAVLCSISLQNWIDVYFYYAYMHISLSIFQYFSLYKSNHRRCSGLQLYWKSGSSTGNSCEYWKIFRTSILKNICERLLLILQFPYLSNYLIDVTLWWQSKWFGSVFFLTVSYLFCNSIECFFSLLHQGLEEPKLIIKF